MIRQFANKPVRVVQITDTHLFRDPTAELLKLNTQESFEHVLELVSENEERVDLVLATGDIAQDGSREAYSRFMQAMTRFRRPFYWIPGNHDRRHVMESVPGQEEAFRSSIRAGQWQIIMLDSALSGEVHGWLAEDQLQLLEAELSAADARQTVHCLICLHHNPVPGDSQWMEGIGLRNAEEFFAILDRHSSVRAVMYGHIHQSLDFHRKGVRYLCSPSTSIQFKRSADDFALDDRNPAYRWLALHTDGSIETGVERVSDHRFSVDHSSAGY